MGPLISGNSRLVKYYFIWPDPFQVVVSNIFSFHPKPWGFMIQIDLRIFFKLVGSTTNQLSFFGARVVTMESKLVDVGDPEI